MPDIQIEWKDDQAIIATRKGIARGLMKAGHHLRTEAHNQAPVREGTLRGTAQVTPISDNRVAVHFNTAYAVRQHEETGWKHPQGGKAKYLEDPLHSEAHTLRALIGQGIREELQ